MFNLTTRAVPKTIVGRTRALAIKTERNKTFQRIANLTGSEALGLVRSGLREMNKPPYSALNSFSVVALTPSLAQAAEESSRIPLNAPGWGTLALINAGIAQSKNRGGLNWFLVSLLLGPVATLLVVISSKLPEGDKPI